MAHRNRRGRFATTKPSRKRFVDKSIQLDHNYSDVSCYCLGYEFGNNCDNYYHADIPKTASRDSWIHGRRVIELGILLNNLKACTRCKLGPIPLTVYNVVGELRKGLGGYLYVRCENAECRYVNRVAYGKMHRVKKTGMPCFAANTKLGVAMIDSVGGSGKVNNLLSTLNVKPIPHANLQKMERRAGHFVESVAKSSLYKAAEDAFKQEMSDIATEESKNAAAQMSGIIEDLGVCCMPDASPATIKNFTSSGVVESSAENTPLPKHSRKTREKKHDKIISYKGRRNILPAFPCKSRFGMSCAVDTAWQKRGFDSLSAHTFFMSKAHYGKKVVKSLVSHRQCATCTWWRRNRPGQQVRAHRCVMNHTGSARLMEATSGEKGILDLAAQGTPVEYCEGDGDTTLLSRLKVNQGIDMKKRFDKNHVMKNIGKSLYSLQAEKGVKLSKISITHIQKCISYALSKNRGDENGLVQNLRAIIPHNFGDHQLCQARFCEKVRNPGVTYIHRSLPYKHSLSGDQLRSRLDILMAPIIARAGQLVDLGSSQQCEHANREVTLRAPKNIHYGGTEALDFRVQATSAFINEGRQYITQVNSEASLSPGKYTAEYSEKCAKKRKYTQDVTALPSSKRHRIILKQERSVNQMAKESLEGVSYQSGVGHGNDADIEAIPEPVSRGMFKPVEMDGVPTYVVFDLETTDLIRGDLLPHLTQLAAQEVNSGIMFNRYIVPEIPISPSAERITKICMQKDSQMLVNGIPVISINIKQALTDFLHWLKTFHNVVLVAHNGRRFDFVVFTSALINCGLFEEFLSVVPALCDSLPVFKSIIKDQESYKQESLARNILHIEYNAHNAEHDVRCLSSLVNHTLNIDKKCFIKKSFTAKDIRLTMQATREKKRNLPSLSILISSGIVKLCTAENIASSGLNYHHLKTIFDRNGEDGLYNVFQIKNSQGQPRVTNVKKTLESVIPKLASHFENKR